MTEITVSDHAALRYQTRADSTEPYPRQRLRELYDDAVTMHDHPQVSDGLAAVVDDLVLVVRDSVVATVLYDGGDR